MADRGDLERMIREDPSDWERWLVYGDFLEQEGDPRGAVIAIEHRLTGGPDPELTRERDRILATHTASWLGALADPAQRGELQLRWHRGFITSAAVTSSDLAARLLALPAGRFVESLSLRSRSRPDTGALAAALEDSIVRDLDLGSNHLKRSDVKKLIEAPAMDRLTSLNLGSNFFGDWGVTDFPRAQRFGALRTLDLSENNLTELGMKWLGSCPSFTSLGRLRMNGCGIGADGAAALSRSRAFSSVTTLELQRAQLGSAGLAELGASQNFDRLVALDLAGNARAAEGLRPLLAGRFRLRSLNLASCSIDEDAAEVLAHHPSTSSLVEVVLAHNPIGRRGVRALASSHHFERLEKLDLWWTELDDESVFALLRLPSLRQLLVSPQHVGERGRRAILDSPKLEERVKSRFAEHLARLG